MFVESLQALDKLQSIVSIPKVLNQMASRYEMTRNSKQAMKLYLQLLNKVPYDPNILAIMGSLFAREDDEPQELHYFQESYRILPTNIDTISWLEVYYVKQELYEKSSIYFKRSISIDKRCEMEIDGNQLLQQNRNFQKALSNYQKIYSEYPDNIECLQFLVQLSREMRLPDEEYAGYLRKLESEMEMMKGYKGQDISLISNEEEQVRLPQRDDNPVNFTKYKESFTLIKYIIFNILNSFIFFFQTEQVNNYQCIQVEYLDISHSYFHIVQLYYILLIQLYEISSINNKEDRYHSTYIYLFGTTQFESKNFN